MVLEQMLVKELEGPIKVIFNLENNKNSWSNQTVRP